MPGPYQKRARYRLKTVLNRLKREREARNRAGKMLDAIEHWPAPRREGQAQYRLQEFVSDSFFGESPDDTFSDDQDGSADNGFHSQDQ